MKRIISTLLVGLFSTFMMVLQVQAQNEPQKIGTVDMEYVLTNLPEFKKLEDEMALYRKQLTAQLESKSSEFQRKNEEYQRGVESGMLLPSIRADKEKELYMMEQSIQDFQTSAENDMQSKYLSLMDPINAKIEASINKVAAANNYTYILSTKLFSSEKIVVYSKYKDANDISILVLRDLGVNISATGVITPPATTPTTTAPTHAAPPTTAPKTTSPVNK